METMEFEEIKNEIEERFKKQELTVQFSPKDDYKNTIVFSVIDKNKKVVLPDQKMPISRISEKASFENYLSSLEYRLKNG